MKSIWYLSFWGKGRGKGTEKEGRGQGWRGRGMAWMGTFFSSSFAFSVTDSKVLSRCFEMGSSIRRDSLPPSLTTYSWLPWTVPRRPSPFTSMVSWSSISEILLPFNLLLELIIRICNVRFIIHACQDILWTMNLSKHWNQIKRLLHAHTFLQSRMS